MILKELLESEIINSNNSVSEYRVGYYTVYFLCAQTSHHSGDNTLLYKRIQTNKSSCSSHQALTGYVTASVRLFVAEPI